MDAFLRRQESIYEQAVALPDEARDAFLDEACGEDVSLRHTIDEMLEAAREIGGFLETPHSLAPEIAVSRRATADLSGERIDRYRLVGKIGEGGAGLVYEAEQVEPVRRRVALKLMKAGTDTHAAIVRFETERQVLALMDHSGIARVFDAGATAHGRLFFVMELVRGARITNYCDEKRLSLEARLELFVRVCRAVQHAHQKGIIHRDLKPSNILVAADEGGPVPKIIDFGIAKAVQPVPDDSTQLTSQEHIIGTPGYMSPEQAQFGACDIDTRSDIYSLGVLLFELLTGRTPLDATIPKPTGVAEICQAVREREAPRPSTCLRMTAGGELARVASARALEPLHLVHAVRGDLDAIVLKALAKDRVERYGTVDQFARDVERFLRDEAVEAHPPGITYRVRKYVRRNRLVVAAAAAVVIALVGGLGAALVGMNRAITARQLAEAAQRDVDRERAAAVTAREESEAVTTFLTQTLSAPSPWHSGPDVTVRALLAEADPRVDQEFSGRPLLQARLHETIGRTYSSLGLFDLAQHDLECATSLRTAQLGAGHTLTLQAQTELAWACSQKGEAAQAVETVRQILAVCAREPEVTGRLEARAQHVLGESLHMLGRQHEGIPWLEKAAASLERELGPVHAETLAARHSVVKSLFIAGQWPRAREICRDVLSREELDRDDPARIRILAMAAIVASHLGYFDDAEKLGRECTARAERVFGRDHGITHVARVTYGVSLLDLGRVDEGLRLIEDAVGELPRVLGENHVNTILMQTELARALCKAGRIDEALPITLSSLPRMRTLGSFASCFAVFASPQAAVLIAAGRCPEAEALCQEMLRGVTESPPPNEYGRSRARLALASALACQGREAEARVVLLANQATLAALPFDVQHELRLTSEALNALAAPVTAAQHEPLEVYRE